MQDVAAASGRDVHQLKFEWVCSIANMPDAEMNALLESHYPEVVRVRQLREEHERATGHCVRLHGWWSHSLYEGDDRGDPR